MQEHYGFNSPQMASLSQNGITIKDLFHAAKEFQINHHDMAPITKVSLMIYADNHGDFTELRNKNDRIAMEVFNNLSKKEQAEVIKYFDLIEE
jgi:hypothetical protein